MDTVQSKKMKVEIWSDVMCPYCYMGKQRFEKALSQFPERDSVEVIWKSFQLSPGIVTDTARTIYQFLSEYKGMPIDQGKQLITHVTQMGAKDGLVLNFDNVVVANSLNAHRVLHFAKQHGKQDEMGERLFKAHFSEGKNVDDHSTLVQLGTEIGLDSVALRTALENGSYADAVRTDISEAQQIGVSGVPFFVFNRKYAVSGAQEPKTFEQTLRKTFDEWRKENPIAKP